MDHFIQNFKVKQMTSLRSAFKFRTQFSSLTYIVGDNNTPFNSKEPSRSKFKDNKVIIKIGIKNA